MARRSASARSGAEPSEAAAGERAAGRRRERRVPSPLDPARLEERALAYVARFATTRGKLTDYLRRKLAERGWSGEGEPPEVLIAALVDRLCAAGYVDDAAYARAKRGSLMRRGYGQRRVSQALGAAGIDADTRAGLVPGQRASRTAALAFVRKRRFGAFGGSNADDRALRQKQIAAMLRAGHALDDARALLAIASIAEAEAWAYGDGDDGTDEDGE